MVPVRRDLRVGFAGTPEFARVALDALHAAGYPIPIVLTQPDRPAGRGMQLQPSPVKQAALGYGVAVLQPRSLRLDGKHPADAEAAGTALRAARLDVLLVAAYGLILPQWVLDVPRLGCINIHASLLPRWRGAAPIHRAVEAGDAQTGVTLMQMDAGLDTGDMLLAERLPIGAHDTTGSLHDRLAALGARLAVEGLGRLARGQLPRTPQPAEGATYAAKIDKAEALVDWSQPAAVVGRRIRAFDPFPGASTTHAGQPIKLFSYEINSDPRSTDGRHGLILSVSDAGIDVQCGAGTVLRLTGLQRAGGKRLAAADFVRGYPLAPGQCFGA